MTLSWGCGGLAVDVTPLGDGLAERRSARRSARAEGVGRTSLGTFLVARVVRRAASLARGRLTRRAVDGFELAPISMPAAAVAGGLSSNDKVLDPGSGTGVAGGAGAGAEAGGWGLAEVRVAGSGSVTGGGAGGASGAGGGWEAPRGGRSESGST